MIHSLFDYCDRVAGEEKRAFVDLEYEHRLCEALEMCVMGELPNGKKNLIINVPPRCFKTTFTSQGFVSWCLAEVAPDCEFILTSATAGLATENTMAVHRILSSEWHRAQYPETIISRESRELQNFFKTTAGGAVYGVGLGGTITGFGAGKVRKGFGGAIVIDDPLKADDAKSRVRRENCISYYLNTLKSRRNNAHNTPFILIMQRLHVDDLAGWLLKNEPDDWHLVSFPALNDNEVLNPITLSKDDLETLKVVAPTTFFAQYQQSPLIPGGNIIKLPWWNFYDPAQYTPKGLRYITADTAYKEHDDNDQSVVQCWEGTESGLYFIDSMYGRWDFPKLLLNSKLFYNVMDKPREFWIEDKASGTPLEQTLSDTGLPAFAWNPNKFSFPADKVARMQEASWFVHGGKVFLPLGNVPVRIDKDTVVNVTPGAAALMEEAAAFARDMSHAHDDHCDAFTMAVSLYKDAGGNVSL